jgi:ectoine hydroxylase-related dioxygenase (phytanoyl-CoA dioxygenase family)
MNETVLDAQDIEFFRVHGWWLSPPILSDEVLEDLKFGIERYFAGERDWLLPVSLGELGGDATPVRQTDYLSLQIKEFRQAIEQKSVASIAAQLAETASVRLFHDQLVTKPPYDPSKAATVGWHTDRAYWRTCSSKNMITAWIPLDDVPEERGPLAVWDGSHRWPGVEDLHSFGVTDLGSIEDRFRALGLPPDIVVLPMRRGQVSFHHCRLVHGGFANRTANPRYGYAVHMQDAENRFDQVSGEHRGHINDLMCRRTPDGFPDYEDPDFFPQLWP